MTSFAVVCGVLSALISVLPAILIVLLLAHHRSILSSRNMNTTDKFMGRAPPDIVTSENKTNSESYHVEEYTMKQLEEQEEMRTWR